MDYVVAGAAHCLAAIRRAGKPAQLPLGGS